MLFNKYLFFFCSQKLDGATVVVKAIHDSLDSKYGLFRIELNKLSSASHPNILQFIGLIVVPPAIILEYAPLGSLHNVLNQYKERNCPICPSSLAMILYQVNIVLNMQEFIRDQNTIFSCIDFHL